MRFPLIAFISFLKLKHLDSLVFFFISHDIDSFQERYPFLLKKKKKSRMVLSLALFATFLRLDSGYTISIGLFNR